MGVSSSNHEFWLKSPKIYILGRKIVFEIILKNNYQLLIEIKFCLQIQI